jgi:hypothetical protein
MRVQRLSSWSYLIRGLLIFAVSIILATTIAEITPQAFSANAVAAAGESFIERNRLAATESTPSYRWNLNDGARPLISLPDHLGGSLDFSLTYSLDQFEFPLFQSLYYNQRSGKYILMVIANSGVDPQTGRASVSPTRHAEFITLAPSSLRGSVQFSANGKSGLRLEDKGGVKLLTTNDGSVYTFSTLADGELHCRQINDRRGAIISLKYTPAAALATISDERGRTVSFSYDNDYLSSVAQSWGGNTQRLRQTWAIADEVKYAHAVAASAGRALPAAAGFAKHIPSNAIKPAYTQAMAASDLRLAAMFGGPGAIAAANGFEPARLGHQYPLYRGDLIGDDGSILRGHLSFAMHLYGSADGCGELEVYVPAGFASHSEGPSPTDAVVTFYYPRLGNLTDVTLAVFHVKNFQLSYEGERVRIGNIGGPGGSVASYKHSHLEFYHGNTGLPPLAERVRLRIDPATIFGSTFESRVSSSEFRVPSSDQVVQSSSFSLLMVS